MFHLSDRELHLLGQPTRSQTVELVGWMVLNNIFGITTSHVCDVDELPSRQAAQWIGGLTGITGFRGPKKQRAKRQQLLPNERRRVRARSSQYSLATGKH